ncbi:MAG TPA: acetyl-CoA carboxylase biotin carboxyl carrier protein [Polyangiaceae bacterium]|nr:acetyl-CoA carboxylase biotin carboxyl carrier protein [Polyangiaceae bacterium]
MLSQKELEGLLRTLESEGVSEFEYEDEKVRVRVAFPRGAAAVAAMQPLMAPAAVAAAPAAPGAKPAAAAEDAGVVFVTSPFVGTFYTSPSPEAPTFVEVGAAVKKGQTLCIIEAMKLMNEIEAEQAGTILEVLAENGKSVEFGQKLFKMRKA